MPFVDMIKELRGAVVGLPLDYAKTLINRARADVYRQNLWSFKIYDASWTSPGEIVAGTVTVTQGSTTATLDATAKAALNAAPQITPVTQRQFRIGIGTIYNIYAYNSGTGVLTFDRNYQEPSAVGSGYQIFQCYYPTPFQDHETFISIRDMVNYIDLFLEKTRGQVDTIDPQRTFYYFPTDAFYYTLDLNPVSTTFQFPLYELWGPPLSQFTYQLYGIRKGLPLVNPSDTLPPQIGEDCVMALARVYAYEWAEANKGVVAKNVGPDFRFLMGAAKAEYDRLFKEYRKDDRELVNNFFAIRRSSLYGKYFAYYNAVSGTAYPG